MARRWTFAEEVYLRSQLKYLYIEENKTISEIGEELKIAESTVYDRLIRLGIPLSRSSKAHYNNQRTDVRIPEKSEKLAELFGILLGDGHLSHFQVTVTLGTKEVAYAKYVRDLIEHLCGGTPRISTSNRGHRTVYLGSTLVVKWLKENGLAQNKVAAQVDVPPWILEKPKFTTGLMRGFFDTDGSIYRLKFRVQISMTNYSTPLLQTLQSILKKLGYYPSAISSHRIYLTRGTDIDRFFSKVRPANAKHVRRYKEIRVGK